MKLDIKCLQVCIFPVKKVDCAKVRKTKKKGSMQIPLECRKGLGTPKFINLFEGGHASRSPWPAQTHWPFAIACIYIGLQQSFTKYFRLALWPSTSLSVEHFPSLPHFSSLEVFPQLVTFNMKMMILIYYQQ